MNDERRTTSLDRIDSFVDLNAWKESHALVVLVYKITSEFPKEESFGLISQMRRAAVSITSNIAEGFGRDTYADKAHFYIIGHASLYELLSQIYVSKDVGFITSEQHDELLKQADTAHKILRGLIRSTKEKK